MMRRSLTLLSVATLATATSVAIAPVSSAGSVGRLVMTGNLAQFDWQTCPNDERGVPCRRTEIIASDQVVHETNDHLDAARRGELIRWGGPAVILRIWDYTLDPETGEYVMLRESFGGIGLPGVEGTARNPIVRIDTRLRSVTVRASDMRMDVSYPDREERTTASVALTATGSGPLRRIHEGEMWWSLGGKWVQRAQGWQRNASGIGTVDGTRVTGTLVAAELQHGRYTEVTTVKGPMKSIAELAAATSASTALGLRHFTEASGGAYWDSCARAEVGHLCRQVYVGYDVTSTSRGEQRATASLYDSVLRITEIVDGQRMAETVSDLVASDLAAEVTAGRDLGSGRVDVADASAEQCTYAGPDEMVCLPVTVGFTASFTGVGSTTRINEHSIVWDGRVRGMGRVGGLTRGATATGSLEGTPFPGTSTDASISYVRGFVK